VNGAAREIERGGEWVQCRMPSSLKQEVSTGSAQRCQCALSTAQVHTHTHTHTHTHDLTGFSIERLGKRAREMLPCALAVCDRGLWDTSSDVYVTCKKEK